MCKSLTVTPYELLDLESLDESSLSDLDRSAVATFPATQRRQHIVNTVRVTSYTMVPGQNTLLIKANVRNTNNNSRYKSTIQFNDVQYSDEQDPNAVKITASDGHFYFLVPLDIQNTEVQVSCNCMDFYWRFAMWNSADNSLLGPKPDPYTRKTKNRPPANPRQTPGLCKHLMKLSDTLELTDLFK